MPRYTVVEAVTVMRVPWSHACPWCKVAQGFRPIAPHTCFRQSRSVNAPHKPDDDDPIELARKYVVYYGGVTLALLVLAKLLGWI